MNNIKRYIWVGIFFVVIALAFVGILHRDRRQLVPVLTYHSIMPVEYYYPLNADNPWILREDVFYAQMRYLYENGFNTLNTTQLVDFLFYEGQLPPNPVVITFDDGYLDNMLFAAPIMQQFGLNGIIFTITSLIEGETQAMTAYPMQFMSEADMASIMDVFEFAAHGHYFHQVVDGVAMLASESVADIKADVLRSFETPLTCRVSFAYPYGIHSPNALQALSEAGIRIAFTTRERYVRRNTNPLLLPRFSVWGGEDGMTIERFSDTVRGRR
ncbi:MAG: polysaccharide deacetylase family protein [Defluviitaleaceae bacterium]|nr:polysaccharide deacetylase family protein [Defluviitaleaceae bacterium]